MIDTRFAKGIAKLTDTELASQLSSAYISAFGESYGYGHEAHADALQEYRMLAREHERRQAGATIPTSQP